MTEQQLRDKLVETAKSYLGYNEANGSHKIIIDLYNSHKPLVLNYKVRYTDAWCSTFVSAMAIKCGYTDIIPTECGCERHIQLFKKIGSWVENDAYVPKAGDIVFYDWDDSGVGDNTGFSDHVGIVVSVSGNSIKIIEGNMSNAVGYRTLQVNARYIRGYGVPKYSTKVTSKPTEVKTEVKTESNAKPKKIEYAKSYDQKLSKTYTTTANLNLRTGAGTNKSILTVIPKGKSVKCYGYYTNVSGTKWYYVQYNKLEGFVSSKYLK